MHRHAIASIIKKGIVDGLLMGKIERQIREKCKEPSNGHGLDIALIRRFRRDLRAVMEYGFAEGSSIAEIEKAVHREADRWSMKAAQRASWLGLSKKMDPHRKKVDAKARKIQREMKTAVLRKLKSKWPNPKMMVYEVKDAVDTIVATFDTSKKRWKTMSSEIGDAVGDAGDGAMELLDVGIAFDSLDPAVLDWIEARGLELATSVTGTVKEEVRAILSQGMQEGLSTGQVADRISVYFDSSEAWKADRIARTEINAAQAFASSESYKQSGVVTAKEWVAAPDACDDCADNDGEEYELDADDIPLHPS